MSIKINRKIVGFRVNTAQEAKAAEPVKAPSNVVHLHEQTERPEVLEGRTYKLKSPLLDSSLYITINDIVLNKGTEHEVRRPYEIFINSKDTTSHQWVVALTRLMSAVFRKGGDVTFIPDELLSVFDPAGGYMSKDGYIPSIIAEIGKIVKRHLEHVGLLRAVKMEVNKEVPSDALLHATVCGKCHQKSLVLMDGCSTCLSCGASKCN